MCGDVGEGVCGCMHGGLSKCRSEGPYCAWKGDRRAAASCRHGGRAATAATAVCTSREGVRCTYLGE